MPSELQELPESTGQVRHAVPDRSGEFEKTLGSSALTPGQARSAVNLGDYFAWAARPQDLEDLKKEGRFSFGPEEPGEALEETSANGPDREIFEEVRENLRTTSQPHLTLLRRLIAHEPNFLGRMGDFLRAKRLEIRRGPALGRGTWARTNLIGEMAEMTSARVSLEEAETVVGRGTLDRLAKVYPRLQIGRTRDIMGSKAGVEKRALEVLDDRNLRLMGIDLLLQGSEPHFSPFINPASTAKNPHRRTFLFNEATRLYEADAKVVYPRHPAVLAALERLNFSTVPDSLIFSSTENGQLEFAGLLEVKAWSSEEFRRTIEYLKDHPTESGLGAKIGGKKLVFEIEKEKRWYQDQVGLINSAPPVIVLRFLADINDADILAFAQLAAARGYPDLVIQKIPLTRHEIGVLTGAVVKRVDLEKL